jgi:hypothetical protein
MQFWEIAGWIIAAGVTLFLLDRLGVWMEKQGWIYWRRGKGMSSRLGNACLELHSMLEPSKRHVVEVRKKEKRDQVESGDPEDSGICNRPR